MRKAKEHRLRCPWCRSARLVRNGFGVAKKKRVQRYLCNNCLRNTIYPRGGKEFVNGL